MRKVLMILSIVSLLFCRTDAFASPVQPEISAPSAILMDYTTGEILYEKNPDEKRPLASVTKIMTMLLAMEEISSGRMSFDDIITGSEHAKSYGGSTIFLDAGEQMSVSDIMKGIAVASGNDAAVAMGEHICGSESAFVEKMNQKAEELNMTNTNFVNSNGLDAENHYSTARDIALMSRELMKYPEIFSYTTIWMDTLRNGEFALSNTNKLIRFYEGATGLKTGSTSKAGFCISATAKRDNMHLIAVIMGAETSKNRQADATSILDFGFSNYKLENIVESGERAGEIPVEKGTRKYVEVVAADECNFLFEKGNTDNYETELKLKEKLVAPVADKADAGYIKVIRNGKEIRRIPLVCASGCRKKDLITMIKNNMIQWICA